MTTRDCREHCLFSGPSFRARIISPADVAALQRFFDPALFHRAWNEVDISAGDGTLRRIDRLVEFKQPNDALWVLDYKSSGSDTARLDAYRAQVADYCRAVAAVFPGRAVRGALIFADTTLLEVR